MSRLIKTISLVLLMGILTCRVYAAPVLLWQLEQIFRPVDSNAPKANSKAQDENSDTKQKLFYQVKLNEQALTAEGTVMMPLPSLEQADGANPSLSWHKVRLEARETETSGKYWAIVSENNLTMPEGRLWLRNGQLGGWVPSLTGAWLLSKGQLSPELRLAPPDSDYKLSKEQQESLGNESKKQQKLAFRSEEADIAHHAKVRVLFVVTDELARNIDDYRSHVEERVAVNNEIYRASGVKLEIEIANIVTARLEDFSADQILDNLAKSTDTKDTTYGDIPLTLLNPIWHERMRSRADLISVMTYNRPGALCGKAMLNGNSNQVFTYRRGVHLVSKYTRLSNGNAHHCSLDTLGHEVGHNMGLRHSLKQGEAGVVFHYGRGFGVVDSFATVMAYSHEFGSANAVPFYSSPALICPGNRRCGVDSRFSSGADAVKALNEVRVEVSNMHNEQVTLPINEALAELDTPLQSCIEQGAETYLSNEEVVNIDCKEDDIDSFDGLQHFPRLQYIAVNRSNDVSLESFRYLRDVNALDLRRSKISDLRPIAHLKNQLIFLRFFADEMPCQDLNVIKSWNIDRLETFLGCQDKSNDLHDFDSDGINNLLDIDDDNDGIDDLSDALPFNARNRGDSDADNVPDEIDAFPYDPNEQYDSDLDTLGDNRDSDDDNDGVPDVEDCSPFDPQQSTDCDWPGPQCELQCAKVISAVPYDFDGDGVADVAVRRASESTQLILNSFDNEIQKVVLGQHEGDISISGDFDADGIVDVGVRRPGNQFWYLSVSSSGDIWQMRFGDDQGDIPVPADYDGDGITDLAVRRPATSEWLIRSSATGGVSSAKLGLRPGDIPVPADYDGDGLADLAIRRPESQIWYIRSSRDGEVRLYGFGMREEDIPVPADYDGDGITDLAVRRPSAMSWFVLRSSDDKIMRVRFGLHVQDVPIVADYDGDGKADVAFRRPSNQTNYIFRSSDQTIERIVFGSGETDMPLAAPISNRFKNTLKVSSLSQDPPTKGDRGTEEIVEVDWLTEEEAEDLEVYDPPEKP